MNLGQRQRRVAGMVAELKRRGLANVTNFRRALRTQGIAVAAKTVYRDLEYLRRELGAPLVYDRSRHGFRLTDPAWTLRPEQLLGDPLFAALLCGRLGMDCLPAPLAAFAEQAVAIQLGATDEPLIRWSLSYGGHLAVISPPALHRAVADAARRILAAHPDPTPTRANPQPTSRHAKDPRKS